MFMRATYRPVDPTGTAYDVQVPPVPGAQQGGVGAGEAGQALGGDGGGRAAALERLLDGDVVQGPPQRPPQGANVA